MDSIKSTASQGDDGDAGRPRAAILVVDDHDLLRLGVRALVQSQATRPGDAVDMFEAGTLADALALYERHQKTIGLVLLDLGLPDTRGLEGLISFRRRYPDARIVVLSGSADPSLASNAVALGAVAYLPKSADLREVVSFVRACGLFEPYADAPPRTDLAAAGLGAAMATGPVKEPLTPRQTQILQWLLEGRANKEIAELAGLSEGTVKNHVSTLLLMFGVRSRAQLISSLR